MILQKRASLKEKASDLISIMISDPLFENNDEIIIDECLTFFVAGTLT